MRLAPIYPNRLLRVPGRGGSTVLPSRDRSGPGASAYPLPAEKRSWAGLSRRGLAPWGWLGRMILVMACLLGLGPSALAAPPVVRIGVLAPEGAPAAEREWQPFASSLERALGDRGVRLQAYDLAGLRGAVERREVDFFIASSGFFVEMEAKSGAMRLATLESSPRLSPSHSVASTILVRADRGDLNRLTDLKGQRVMAVSEDAFSGYQLAWRELRRAGVEPRRDFAALIFSGFPLNHIVEAVGKGEVDGGIVRACVLEHLVAAGRVKAGDFKVLGEVRGDELGCRHSTPLYPDWSLAALRGTPYDLTRRVSHLLFSLPPSNGVAWTVPTDYQPVHGVFRDLGIGPYAALGPRDLWSLLRDYWWGLALALLVLAAMAAHSVRVEVLVHRRTRELQAALEARQQAEEAARRQEEKLDHLGRLGVLGEMSSMLAHELAQPLAAIGNFARGMTYRIQGGRLDPAPLLEGCQTIEQQAERAARVMEQVRAFSRKRPVRKAPLDLCALARETVVLFRGMVARAPDIQLHCGPSGAPGSGCLAGLTVEGDALQLQQVLLNLLKNAYDAARDLPEERRAISLILGRAPGRVTLAVADRGRGLAPGDRERLFEPFFTTKEDGVGLGLSMCQRILEAHGGAIAAHSPEDGGPGLVMEISLPCEESPHAP